MKGHRLVNYQEIARNFAGADRPLLGQGMEGSVFEMDAGRVLKVWHSKSEADVKALRNFYKSLVVDSDPISTPLIYEVLRERQYGLTLSIEKRVSGTPLKQKIDISSAESVFAGFGVVERVLSRLARTNSNEEGGTIPVMGARNPWLSTTDWGPCLATLCNSRAGMFMSSLDGKVHRCSEKLARLTNELVGVTCENLCVVHGDVCTENILVNPAMQPTGIIDFGFLSMNGDPIFDAVVASQIFSMYDPRASQVRDTFAQRMHTLYGPVFADRYHLYRAAYAFITSNAYSPSGSDGHFSWCVDILNDHAVEERLLSSR